MTYTNTEALRALAKVPDLPHPIAFMLLDVAAEIDLLRDVAEDLEARILWMIETWPGWSEEGVFTFPDGDAWRRLPDE